MGKNLSSGGHKVTLHDFWQPRVSRPKQARPSQVRRRQCRESTKGQTSMDLRFPEVVLCGFCGSVGHAANVKCKYCEVGRVDQLEALPQGKVWRDAPQQAGISSASQLRKQVARGRCVPCRGCGAFNQKHFIFHRASLLGHIPWGFPGQRCVAAMHGVRHPAP